MKDVSNFEENFESFLEEANSIQNDCELLHHQMNSTIRCMTRVNTRIKELTNHEMFSYLPDEVKKTLFNFPNIREASDEIKSKL
jgi:hypothetical protein